MNFYSILLRRCGDLYVNSIITTTGTAMIDLSNKIVNFIRYKYVGGEYGLHILMQLGGQEYLFFDSFQFSVVSNICIDDFLEVRNSEKLIGEYIISIRQDESTNYFIQFSNSSILHIYQKIFNWEHYEQDFEILSDKDLEYSDVKKHQEEDWIFESPITVNC